MEYTKFTRSLEHLAAQWDNHERAAKRPELAAIDREAIAESVIQRFETCYDMAWKHLRRHLVEVLGVPEVPASPKPLLRVAAENGLLGSALDRWLLYAEARINTAHDYDGDKAATTLALVPGFLTDARAVHDRMTGSPWLA